MPARLTPPRHWTDEEINFLRTRFFDLSDSQLGKELRRTTQAVSLKRKQLHLSRIKSTKDGGYTLAELARETGYEVEQLRRVKERIGQHWSRRPPGMKHETKDDGPATVYLITQEQADALVTELRTEWGPGGLKACERCKRTNRPHKARGFCNSCYVMEQRKVREGKPSLLYTAHVHTPSKVKFKPEDAPKQAA